MFIGSSLLLPLLVLTPSDPAHATEPDSVTWAERWQSLDDPNLEELPAALADLDHAGRAVFEAVGEPSLLLVRRLPEAPSPVDAFVTDEEAMLGRGELIPLEDRILPLGDSPEEEGFALDCEWSTEGLDSRLTALYAPAEDGVILGLWLLTTTERGHAELEAELLEMLPHFRKSLGPAPGARYTGIQLGHRVSFDLAFEDEAVGSIVLRPVDELPGEEAELMDALAEANPQFDCGVVQRWRDDERGVDFSYQVIAHDLSFGPSSPFVNWIAGQFTTFYRIDKDTGDFPIDQYHRPDERTHVVSDEELQRHYGNNARAPEAGVILQVYVPRSPYANSCQIAYRVEDQPEEEEPETPPAGAGASPHGGPPPHGHGAGGPHLSRAPTGSVDGDEAVGEFGLVRFCELRQYRRSRSETITRKAVVMLVARASSRAELDLLDRELDLVTTPLYRERGVLTREPAPVVGGDG